MICIKYINIKRKLIKIKACLKNVGILYFNVKMSLTKNIQINIERNEEINEK